MKLVIRKAFDGAASQNAGTNVGRRKAGGGSGEGSRGGHITGHTKSGEPIYEGHASGGATSAGRAPRLSEQIASGKEPMAPGDRGEDVDPEQEHARLKAQHAKMRAQYEQAQRELEAHESKMKKPAADSTAVGRTGKPAKNADAGKPFEENAGLHEAGDAKDSAKEAARLLSSNGAAGKTKSGKEIKVGSSTEGWSRDDLHEAAQAHRAAQMHLLSAAQSAGDGERTKMKALAKKHLDAEFEATSGFVSSSAKDADEESVWKSLTMAEFVPVAQWRLFPSERGAAMLKSMTSPKLVLSNPNATSRLEKASQLGLFGGGGGGGGGGTHKYLKRTGTPGHYRYEYATADHPQEAKNAVVGRTSGSPSDFGTPGTPIHGHFDHPAHSRFDGKEHAEAAAFHRAAANHAIDTQEDSADRREMVQHHRTQAEKHEAAASKFGNPAAGKPYADKPRTKEEAVAASHEARGASMTRDEREAAGGTKSKIEQAFESRSEAQKLNQAKMNVEDHAKRTAAAGDTESSRDAKAASKTADATGSIKDHNEAATEHAAAAFEHHEAGRYDLARHHEAERKRHDTAVEKIRAQGAAAIDASVASLKAASMSHQAHAEGTTRRHAHAALAHQAAARSYREAGNAAVADHHDKKAAEHIALSEKKKAPKKKSAAPTHAAKTAEAMEAEEDAHDKWAQQVKDRSEALGESFGQAATHKVGGEKKSHMDKLHEAIADIKPEKMTKPEHFEAAHAKFKALHDHLETKLGSHPATAHASKAAGHADHAKHFGGTSDKYRTREARSYIESAQQHAKNAVDATPDHVKTAATQGRFQDAAHFLKRTKGWSGKDHEEAAIAHRVARSHHIFAADKIPRYQTAGGDESHSRHRALAEHHGDMTQAHEAVASSERVKASGDKPGGPRSWDEIAHVGVKDAFRSADEGHKMRNYSPDMHKTPEGKSTPKFDAAENAALDKRVRESITKKSGVDLLDDLIKTMEKSNMKTKTETLQHKGKGKKAKAKSGKAGKMASSPNAPNPGKTEHLNPMNVQGALTKSFVEFTNGRIENMDSRFAGMPRGGAPVATQVYLGNLPERTMQAAAPRVMEKSLATDHAKLAVDHALRNAYKNAVVQANAGSPVADMLTKSMMPSLNALGVNVIEPDSLRVVKSAAATLRGLAGVDVDARNGLEALGVSESMLMERLVQMNLTPAHAVML